MKKNRKKDKLTNKHTADRRAGDQCERTENIAEILQSAAISAGDETAYALSARMKRCSTRSNYYVAEDLHNESGECFDGFGQLYSCGSKLCAACLSKSARRNRKRAGEAIKATKLKRRKHKCLVSNKDIVEQERYRFVTLTMPKVSLSCWDTLVLLARTWDLFRKLEFTKVYLPGYVKSLEFTVRPDLTYHAHIHLLAISYFIPEDLIKQNWQRCLQTAYAEAGLDWHCETRDNKPVVNLKLVDDVDQALLEICKYVTKSDSWEKIPAEHLLEIANIGRWGRMYALAGSLKETDQRLQMKKKVAAEVAVEMAQETALESSSDDDLNYLDTKCITDGENEVENEDNFSESCPEVEKKSLRQENWRILVKKKGLKAYLKILERQVEATQRIRKSQLAEKYPLASFTDLTGFRWYQPKLEFMEELPVNQAV